MNKRLLFLSIIFLSTCLQISAQYTNVDFESGGNGASWNWIVDQNTTPPPPLEFELNPDNLGINPSTIAAKFTAKANGASFALTYTDNIEPFVFDGTNSTVTIMIYKTVYSNIEVKFEGAGSPPLLIQIANSEINQWEEITYDFSTVNPNPNNIYTRLVIVPDFQARTQDNIIYFDNIQIPAGNIAPAPAPATAAPTPIHNETTNNVISIFSDAYTNVAGTDTNPNWGQATISTQVSIEGNNTLKYANLNYQGTQFGSNQNVSGRDFLHVDFWTANSTDLRFFLITEGNPDGAPFILPTTSATQGQWNSVDMPIGFFQSANIFNVNQFKVEGNGDVWFDNLYFYTSAALPIELSSFSAKAEDNRTHLYWETATETNNDYFQIEKSVDGISFSPITKVNGAGTSSSPQSYEAWDNSPSTGINYYRLKQVDMDGTFSYSNTVSVRFKSDRTLSLVNRRIVDQNIQLTYEVPNEGKYSLMIVDATGRVLHRDELDLTEGLNEIAFDTPAVGVLMLVLSNRNERSVDKIFK